MQINKVGELLMDREISVQYVLDQIAHVSLGDEDDAQEVYRIGDLAKHFDVSLRTLRFYEDRGLISPKRSGSTRLYDHNDFRRIKLIVLAKSVGFSLVCIQNILNIYDEDSADEDRLDEIRAKFNTQRTNLLSQRTEIDQSISDLEQAIASLDDLA